MKLDRDQKLMLGTPAVFATGLLSLILPIALAARLDNPLWLLLWIAGGFVTGAVCAALRGWTDR